MNDRQDNASVTNLSISVSGISENLSQHVIFVTQDRLELRLRDYTAQIYEQKQLSGPVSTFLTFAGTLSTAKFNDFQQISADQIAMIFYVGTGLSTLWLVWALRSRFFRPRNSIPDLIAKIRTDEQVVRPDKS